MDDAANKRDQIVPPDKLYFRIGEVSEITEMPSYVLRFWETEFKKIKPKRTSSGQRLYRKSDVEMVLKIKHLLHEKKYTIRGAKQFLLAENGESEKTRRKYRKIIEEIGSELKSIRELLN